MGILNVDAYPLYWPETWARTDKYNRRKSRYEVNFAKARDDISRELKLLGAREIVISTNVAVRKDGLPYANMPEPTDPGVAVYWVEQGAWNTKLQATEKFNRVIACDHWRTVRENMRAANLAIQAMRALKRTGATQVIEKAFTGFNALPAGNTKRNWRAVFKWGPGSFTRDHLDTRFRELTHECHPDKGGSNEAMRELIEARDQALLEL